MTDARRAFGQAGEEQAAAWYRARGYEVIDRNWRCRDGELDLVARRGRTLVFVEVKARRTDRFGIPAEAVTPTKQRRLRALARRYLEATDVRPLHAALRRREHPRRPARGDRGGVLSAVSRARPRPPARRTRGSPRPPSRSRRGIDAPGGTGSGPCPQHRRIDPLPDHVEVCLRSPAAPRGPRSAICTAALLADPRSRERTVLGTRPVRHPARHRRPRGHRRGAQQRWPAVLHRRRLARRRLS